MSKSVPISRYWWKFTPHFDSLGHSIVHYAGVAATVNALLDIPVGWESYTILDNRTSIDDRKRIYKQSGELAMANLGTNQPHWYSAMVTSASNTLLAVAYSTCVAVECDTTILVGIAWHAALNAAFDRERNIARTDWKVL